MEQTTFTMLINTITDQPTNDEVPVSACVINPHNEVVAIACNDRQASNSISGHAEINAINKAFEQINTTNLEGYKIFTTLEPCTMCFGAIEQAKISEVHFLVDNPHFGFTKKISINDLKVKYHQTPNPELRIKYENILSDFFKSKR